MIASYSYALAVNFVPAYRVPADQVGDSSIGLTGGSSSKNDIEKSVDFRAGRSLDGAEVIEVEKLEARRTSMH